jgi:nucleotidyltransferase/DNA polymerase involved in DNA repair
MIAHLDVDCFFAQVEEVRLSIRGKPLGVQQNMEIAAVNYEAREHGLYNRISLAEGLRRCPSLVLVRGDNEVNAMQRYRCAGQAVLRCVMQSLDDAEVAAAPACSGASELSSALRWAGRPVEHASFDDFFVLLPEHLASVAAATAWAERLRCTVLRATGLRCSIGIARTKLLSVLATKQAKPDGLYCCCSTAAEHALLDSARIDRICGAGLKGLPAVARAGLQRVLGKVNHIFCAHFVVDLMTFEGCCAGRRAKLAASRRNWSLYRIRGYRCPCSDTSADNCMRWKCGELFQPPTGALS